ncbi:MAG: hypothetical protein HQK53_00830 [Oligoflexia bacterium]|nr:hypothetical protein [Oligoflexia bacterium]
MLWSIYLLGIIIGLLMLVVMDRYLTEKRLKRFFPPSSSDSSDNRSRDSGSGYNNGTDNNTGNNTDKDRTTPPVKGARVNTAPDTLDLDVYYLPRIRKMFPVIFFRTYLYLKKAGTVILAASIVLWFISSYPSAPSGPKSKSIKNIEYSYLGQIGKAIEPLIAPMGLDWKIGTALIGALVAKEIFIAQMSIIFAVSESNENSQKQIQRAALVQSVQALSVQQAPEGSEHSVALTKKLSEYYTPLIGICIVVFILNQCTLHFYYRHNPKRKWLP